MTGTLPSVDKNLPKCGPFVNEPEVLDFSPGSDLPSTFLFWRPPESFLTISPPEHPGTPRITIPGESDSGFTLFDLSVDLLFTSTVADSEAGITIVLTEFQHIDLGIVSLRSSNSSSISSPRFRAETSGERNYTAPEETVLPISHSWSNKPVRLAVSAKGDSLYTFTASLASRGREVKSLGSASAETVSGGSGPFTGTVIGIDATRNNGTGMAPAYFNRRDIHQ
ncbi:putative Arabinofuranosidase [Seiridium cardinale]|uniref:Arabinofuranosidase n=1 Tax=Seiridium cardinale TaxID=138064 RepID=A0ABR2XIV1_9PEZI